jgi:hypothetical protein
LTYAVLWSAGSALVLFAPRIFDLGDLQVPAWMSKFSIPGGALGTLITGAIIAWKGFSPQTPSGRGVEDIGKPKTCWAVNIALPLLLLLIVLGLARVTDPLLFYAGLRPKSGTRRSSTIPIWLWC